MATARETMTMTDRPLQFVDPSAPVVVRALVAEHGSPLVILDLAAVRRQYQALAAARKYVAPGRLVVIAIGDRARIEPGLKDLGIGPVEVFTP